jgi:uncharacterized membrane protein (UPF0127 family)
MHSPLKTRHYRAQMIAPGIHSLVRMASLLMVLLLLGLRSPPAVALESLDAFPTSTLSIRTRQGPPEWFSVWIADTAARSEQGLMFVKWLPADQGMLFPFQQPHTATFWMKNTLIALDMLFIDAQGRIVYIRESATPMSEAIISAPMPVKAVLELAGGECARLGIRTGDQVRHRLFGSATEGPVRN